MLRLTYNKYKLKLHQKTISHPPTRIQKFDNRFEAVLLGDRHVHRLLCMRSYGTNFNTSNLSISVKNYRHTYPFTIQSHLQDSITGMHQHEYEVTCI